jgi:hypothetical protein
MPEHYADRYGNYATNKRGFQTKKQLLSQFAGACYMQLFRTMIATRKIEQK